MQYQIYLKCSRNSLFYFSKLAKYSVLFIPFGNKGDDVVRTVTGLKVIDKKIAYYKF